MGCQWGYFHHWVLGRLLAVAPQLFRVQRKVKHLRKHPRWIQHHVRRPCFARGAVWLPGRRCRSLMPKKPAKQSKLVLKPPWRPQSHPQRSSMETKTNQLSIQTVAKKHLQGTCEVLQVRSTLTRPRLQEAAEIAFQKLWDVSVRFLDTKGCQVTMQEAQVASEILEQCMGIIDSGCDWGCGQTQPGEPGESPVGVDLEKRPVFRFGNGISTAQLQVQHRVEG